MDAICFEGKQSAFLGLVRESYSKADWERIEGKYDVTFIHNWWECYESYADSPGTKTVRCLRETFNLVPERNLLTYSINIRNEAKSIANAYVRTLPDQPFVVLHYEGSSFASEKNLSHAAVAEVCEYLLKTGRTPVILDWEGSSPLPNNRTVFCPDKSNALWKRYGTGDAETIAALIERAALFIGIDSGPQKVAFATETPTIAVWTGNHPYHFADNTSNSIHLIPENHMDYLRGNKQLAMKFFSDNYWSTVYPRKNLAAAIKQVAARVSLVGA
jgi:ADP-heptose:LPS heptosyltransferase